MPHLSVLLFISVLVGTLHVKESAKSILVETMYDHEKVFPCGKCDYIIKGYHNNGEKLNISPGEVVCFDASMKYEKIVLSKLKGTAEKPIIVRNCGGVARVSSPNGFAVKFEESEHFKILGDGVEDSVYGLKLTTRSGFFLAMEKFTTDFEIARIEIAGATEKGLGQEAGFAGIGIETSPYQDCNLFADSTRQGWVMRNISVHNNYIHDTGGEGMYIGHGFYKGRKESKCQQKTYSHAIKGLRVYNNILEDIGLDGIQIKNADEDCEIYNNTIRNYGTRGKGAHNEGLFIGEGVTGKAYNNLIHTGTGHGIQFQGMGNNIIYNNIIINAGEDGFNGTGSTMSVFISDGYFMIINNTIYNSGEDGFVFFHNKGGKKYVMNNLVVRAGKKLTSRGGILDSSNNIFTQATDRIRFMDTLLTDLRPAPGSPVVDKGMDIRKICKEICYDFLQNPRPHGKGFDIGAYEFN